MARAAGEFARRVLGDRFLDYKVSRVQVGSMRVVCSVNRGVARLVAVESCLYFARVVSFAVKRTLLQSASRCATSYPARVM